MCIEIYSWIFALIVAETFIYNGGLVISMSMDENLINIAISIGIIYLVIGITNIMILIYDKLKYRVEKFLRRDIYSFYNDPLYIKFESVLNELDTIEARKKELHDAPNKLCNRNCTTRQKYIISLYEENYKFLDHIQTALLIQLRESLKNLWGKYEKYYLKIKKKYNLPDSDVKWNAELTQYV